MTEDNDSKNSSKAIFNVVIAYSQPTKAVVTWHGFNKEQVREEVTEHFDHIDGLVIETIDLVEGAEATTDNVVQFKPKESE